MSQQEPETASVDAETPKFHWWQAGRTSPGHEPRWWVRDVIIAVFIGAVLIFGQMLLDDARSNREIKAARIQSTEADQREDLRFVRDRSGVGVQERPFQSIDLSGQTLSGLQLEGADFTDANLEGAQMVGINLRGAILRHLFADDAHLLEANLAAADLRDVWMSRATLIDADLTGADLTGATLMNDVFFRANITDANFTRTDLRGASLDGVIGFDPTAFNSVCYDTVTQWPAGYTPPPSDENACNQYYD